MSSKFLILNDVHFGVRNGSQIFMDYQSKVYDFILKYVQDHSITDIIILGDIFDKRKTIDFAVLDFTYKILKKFRAQGVHITVSMGNHDVYYKDTNRLNALDLLLSHVPNVTVLEDCVTLNGFPNIGIVPWITQDNSKECFDFIENNSFDALLGHFEISGFVMHKGGITIHHGLKQDLFTKHKNVYSGHYHYKSRIGNISYLGSQFQFTWSDADDFKYFHVLDAESGSMEPVQIPLGMYTVLDGVPEDLSVVKDMQVRIMTDEEVPEDIMKSITNTSYEVKVIKKTKSTKKSVVEDSEEDYDLSDKLNMVKDYASANELPETGLKKIVSIYQQASS